MRYRLVVVVGVSLLALAAALPAADRAVGAEPPAGAGGMDVTVNEGRLSATLHNAPLADVLHLIGRQARLTVHLDGSLRTPITGTFTGVPLESAIRRLTRGHSSSFAYAAASHPDQAARLIEIWVIESSPGVASAAPADLRARPTRLASVGNLRRRRDDGAIAELRRILAEDPDPVVRTRAALALSRPGDARATPALIAALADRQPAVRIQAVRGLQRVEGDRAGEALGRVLLTDADPSVRRAAASTLATVRSAAAGSALRTVMSADGDASVRQAAATALRRWEQLTRPPPGR
jgi:hypothetical protein